MAKTARKTEEVPMAALAKLEERVANLIEAFERERDGASLHRRELREVVTALSESVRLLNSTVSKIEPIVLDYQEQRAEHRGVVKIGKVLHAFSLFAAALFGSVLHKLWP